MISKTRFENSLQGGMAVMESERGAERWFIPLQHTELNGEVAGPLSEFTLKQIFLFHEKDLSGPIEALYRFPLPGDAAVVGMKVSFGDIEIIAELKERKKVEREYEEARKKGEQAAVLTRESPDVFTLRVTGIEAEQEVFIQTSFIQLGEVHGTGFQFRVPLTNAPRYLREDEKAGKISKGQPLAVLQDPRHRFSMKLKAKGGLLESETYALRIDEQNQTVLQEGEVLPDRDFLINWIPEQKQDRSTLTVFIDREKDPAFLALLTPPMHPALTLPREVIIMVDHSGSMTGAKWQAADWAVEKFLNSLGVGDRFNICLFHSNTNWFSDVAVSANNKTIRKAVDFLKDDSSGGTELAKAIDEGLRIPKNDGEFARHMLIITDAEVYDEGTILDRLHYEASLSVRRRTSIICIDSAPNSYLAEKIAESGRGLVKYLTSNPSEGDIVSALDDVLQNWAAPLQADMHILSKRQPVDHEGHSGGLYRISAGDLISGRSRWVMGKLMTGKVPIGFCVDGGDEAETIIMDGVRKLFAAKRINNMERLIEKSRSGLEDFYSMRDHGFTLKEMNAIRRDLQKIIPDPNMKQMLESMMVQESIQHGVISTMTAYSVLRKEKGKEVKSTVFIPNALPHGWDPLFDSPVQSFSSPRVCYDYKFSLMDKGDPSLFKFNCSQNYIHGGKEGPTPKKKCWQPFHDQLTVLNGEGVIFDGVFKDSSLSYFEKLMVTLTDAVVFGPDAKLRIFIDDMQKSRISVSVEDLMRNKGIRPINIYISQGQRVRIIVSGIADGFQGVGLKIELL